MPWTKFEVSALWAVIVVAFLIMGIWEGARPRQPLTMAAERRWGRHGILLLLGGLVQAVIFRVSPLVVAVAVAGNPWGWLNRPWQPFAVQFVAAILMLDLVRYLTHRLFHANRFLWRIHEIHHSDPDYDVSTAARFHPLEIVFAKALYLAGIAVLAPPLAAVFFSELHTGLLNVVAHANVAIPPRVERLLRAVLITPDLHRLHHSEDAAHHNRNFGQTFVWWDRLFGTYLPGGDAAVTPGVRGVRPEIGVLALIAEPFRRR
jgi:sterol desaturase/sphingolipid hydroxylase (fatty acid hydroxylase superfamily)